LYRIGVWKETGWRLEQKKIKQKEENEALRVEKDRQRQEKASEE